VRESWKLCAVIAIVYGLNNVPFAL